MVCYFKLLFCEARYCPDHVVVRIRAFDLCRIRLGRGGGFSIALYTHCGVWGYSTIHCIVLGWKADVLWGGELIIGQITLEHTFDLSLFILSTRAATKWTESPNVNEGENAEIKEFFPSNAHKRCFLWVHFRSILEHFLSFSTLTEKRVGCQGHERIVQHFLAFFLDDKEGGKEGRAGRSKNFSSKMDTKAPFCRRRSQQIFCQ